MATVNFSVPDEVKEAFDRTFKDCNKSALIAEFMRGAVADEQLRKRRSEAVKATHRLAQQIPPLTDEEIRRAREEGRS